MSPGAIEDFADKLVEVMPVVMRELARRQVREIYEGKITLPQVLVLDYLHSRTGAKMKDLAAELKVSTAAMTGIIDRMVRDKYVARSFDERDRRIIIITPTPKGRALCQKIRLERKALVMQIFAGISPEDRAHYLNVLQQIRKYLLETLQG
jgi:DNA-binding MarR family transcriptional regulator